MSDIKIIQEKELGILREFLKICEKHNLRYYILGGTLLGAVRHGGFIPWDDDIDIGMPRKDYDYLMNLPVDQIGIESPYQLISEKSDPNFTKAFMNLQDSDTKIVMTSSKERQEYALWIDIFPLDGMPHDKVRRFLHGKNYLFSRMLVQLSQFDKIVNLNKKNRPMLERVIIKVAKTARFETLLDYQKCQKRYIKVISKYDMTEKYAGNYTGAYKLREIVPSHYFGKGTKLSFEGIDVTAPEQYKEYLEAIYGPNYMQLPPEEDRVPHEYDILKL